MHVTVLLVANEMGYISFRQHIDRPPSTCHVGSDSCWFTWLISNNEFTDQLNLHCFAISGFTKSDPDSCEMHHRCCKLPVYSDKLPHMQTTSCNFLCTIHRCDCILFPGVAALLCSNCCHSPRLLLRCARTLFVTSSHASDICAMQLGRFRSIQGPLSIMPHVIAETPGSTDFSFAMQLMWECQCLK